MLDGTQQSLLDLMRPPPITRPVDQGATVIRNPHEVLILPHPKMAWDSARIGLHQCEPDLWAWSTSVCTSQGGWAYAVSPKWGRFTTTREDALYWATQEITERLQSRDGFSDFAKIIKWAEGLV